MKLILTQEVTGLGTPGDVVEVKDGYGRNYLVPRGFADRLDQGRREAGRRDPAGAAIAREIKSLERGAAGQARRARGHDGARCPPRPAPTGRLFGAVTTGRRRRRPSRGVGGPERRPPQGGAGPADQVARRSTASRSGCTPRCRPRSPWRSSPAEAGPSPPWRGRERWRGRRGAPFPGARCSSARYRTGTPSGPRSSGSGRSAGSAGRSGARRAASVGESEPERGPARRTSSTHSAARTASASQQ